MIVEGPGNNGSGIRANSVGTLTIEDCTVRNFGDGIFVESSTAAQVSIYNTAVRSCTYGIDIENNAAAITVVASVTGCRVESCTNFGVLAVNAVAGGTVDLTADGCTVRGNNSGLTAQLTGATLRASNCTITGNSTGVQTLSSGQVLSRGNNTLEKNDSGNTFPGAYSAK